MRILLFIIFQLFYQNAAADSHKPQQFLDAVAGKADEGGQGFPAGPAIHRHPGTPVLAAESVQRALRAMNQATAGATAITTTSYVATRVPKER